MHDTSFFEKALRRVRGGVRRLFSIVFLYGGMLFSVLQREGVRGLIWRYNVMSNLLWQKKKVSDSWRFYKINLQYQRRLRCLALLKSRSPKSNNDNPTPVVLGFLIFIRKIEEAWNLRGVIESLHSQSCGNWLLYIFVDSKIEVDIKKSIVDKIVLSEKLIFICYQTQEGFADGQLASLDLLNSDFIGVLDCSVVLDKEAVFQFSERILKTADLNILYSDHDTLGSDGKRRNPVFKPDFDEILQLTAGYMGTFFLVKKEILKEVFIEKEGSSKDLSYNILLSALLVCRRQGIFHIPEILFHVLEDAPKSDFLKGAGDKSYDVRARALRRYFDGTGRAAEITPMLEPAGCLRLVFEYGSKKSRAPLVSIIIPTRDSFELLKNCIESIVSRTSYTNYEIIIVDNGTVDDQALKYLRLVEDFPNAMVLKADVEFNFSYLVNLGVSHASGEYVLLLNNDIEVLTPNWLDEMMSWGQASDVGCVGARLWYPDGRLQHGGVIIGVCGIAAHVHRGISRQDYGYLNRGVLPQNFSAVTGACLLVRKSVYDELKGLDECFAVTCNDLDFCLRVRESGYSVVWTPYAELIHHESASRGVDNLGRERARLHREVDIFRTRWSAMLKDDPFYNINLTRTSENSLLRACCEFNP